MKQQKKFRFKRVFREDDSCLVMATDGEYVYKYTSHAIDRAMERNNNIKTDLDFCHKMARRIAKCINNESVEDWMLDYEFDTRLVIRDLDIQQAYVFVCKGNRYVVITVFNEHKEEFITDDPIYELSLKALNKSNE